MTWDQSQTNAAVTLLVVFVVIAALLIFTHYKGPQP